MTGLGARYLALPEEEKQRYRDLAAEQRAAQGLPPTGEDPSAIALTASILRAARDRQVAAA